MDLREVNTNLVLQQSKDADPWGCLGKMGHTQAAGRWCKVPEAALVHRVHEVRHLEHRQKRGFRYGRENLAVKATHRPLR
jgi:hypothetical protein